MEVARPIVALTGQPNEARERELLLGAKFLVLEDRDGASFGYSGRNNYVGYIESDALHAPAQTPLHTVTAIRSYAKKVPELKDTGATTPLAFSSAVQVIGNQGAWSKITLNGQTMFVPSIHLTAKYEAFSDPVMVAKMFLGTPYLWGGNSAFGIDCSGLIQAALHACGLECPGDADQQQAALGHEIPTDGPLKRGDLVFWKGHVALCIDAEEMIHANAARMAVTCENIAQAKARIMANGDGPIVSRRRL